jgi:hypothetical protein
MPGFEFQPKTTYELNMERKKAANNAAKKAPVKKWPTVQTRKNRKASRKNRKANTRRRR